MNNTANDELVNLVDSGLRVAESDLERLGRMICSVEGSGRSWNAINSALESVRDAIRNTYLMRKI